MNVLFINPPTSNLYARLNASMPPLGLAYLAAILQKFGHSANVVDLGIDANGFAKIDLHSYDLIGITSDTPRYPAALEVAKEAKKMGRRVVMGGYHVTFLDEDALKSGLVDYVVRGEAEETFLKFVNTLEEGNDLEECMGISYMNGETFIQGEIAPPPTHLDQLPFPARKLLPLKEYQCTLNGLPAVNMITSRGCPFKCHFCVSSQFGGIKWRTRSVKSIVDEIEQIQADFDYRAFAFVDDNFTLDPRRVIDFCNELDKRDIHIIWWCFSRADTITRNETMVKRMAEAGVVRVFLGLESASESVLNEFGKKLNLEQERQAVLILKRYGIAVHGSFIIGSFHETKEMISETVHWAKKLQPEVVQFSILTPYPGTALFKQAERENRLLHRSWELYDGWHPVMKLDFLKPKRLQKLFAQAYRKYYLSVSSILHPKFGNETLVNFLKSIFKQVKFYLTFCRVRRKVAQEKKFVNVTSSSLRADRT